MKRALLVVFIVAAVCAVAVGIVITAAIASVDEHAAERPWAAGLGSVESLPTQYPKREASAAALRLTELAAPLGIDFRAKRPDTSAPPAPPAPPELQALGDWLKAEHERAERDTFETPPQAATFLRVHAFEIDALREHLLHGGEIVWPTDLSTISEPPIPNLVAHMQTSRVLVSRGLFAHSWPDLEAAWRISQALQKRPELIAQMIALAIARSVNAAAWKMPVPAPAWVSEMAKVDHVRLLARGMQAEAWYMSSHGVKGDGVASNLFLEWSAADMVDHQRMTVEHLLAMQQCGFDAQRYAEQRYEAIPFWNIFAKMSTPNLVAIWPRALRYRAEQEATMNALRVASGRPVVTRSRCADGTWKLENGMLAFSRPLPPATEQETAMPLTLRVQ